MSNTRTFTAIILLAISFLGGAGRAASIAHAASAPAEIGIAAAGLTVIDDTGAGQRFVDWAENRYELAGLSLPGTEISFHTSSEECAGHSGLHSVNDQGHRIAICAVGKTSRERLMLHELAHAWIHESLTTEQRDAFLTRRGLEVWNDHDTEWEQEGTEHAAEILNWGLNEQCDPRYMLSEESAESLAADFEFLTGTKPICQP